MYVYVYMYSLFMIYSFASICGMVEGAAFVGVMVFWVASLGTSHPWVKRDLVCFTEISSYFNDQEGTGLSVWISRHDIF